MSNRDLKNKPLIETILEVRWALQTLDSPIKAPGFVFQFGNSIPSFAGGSIDPNYKILLGRLFDKFSGEKGEYPIHEQLPSAMMPDEISGHNVQHRFRVAPNEWPLVQVGPGILTVNDTLNYTWEDFRRRSLSAITNVYNAHPKPQELVVESIVLRYLNAVKFNYLESNVFEYLNNKMNINISLSKEFFDNGNISDSPKHYQWQSTFQSLNPKGFLIFNVGTGLKDDDPSIIWELNLNSANEDVPTLIADIESWLDSAHRIIEEWFFKIIDGDLERGFNGE